MNSFFLVTLLLSWLTKSFATDYCPNTPIAASENTDPNNKMEFVSNADGKILVNFDVTLLGGEYFCIPLSNTVVNPDNYFHFALYATNSGHWTSDIQVSFYPTSQAVGGNVYNCGTQIAAYGSAYNQYVGTCAATDLIPTTTLTSGFTEVCIFNTCTATATQWCTDPNSWQGQMIMTDTTTSTSPVTSTFTPNCLYQYPTSQPTSVPSSAPNTKPTSAPTKSPTSVPSSAPNTKPTSPPTKSAKTSPADYVPHYVVKTFAGNNYAKRGPNDDYAISGGINEPATESKFAGVFGLAKNEVTGNFFITDLCVIREVDTNGIISVYAGYYLDTYRSTYYDDVIEQQLGASCGYVDGVNKKDASFKYPYGLAFDTNQNLYVADTENNRIRLIDPITNNVTTVAGYYPGLDVSQSSVGTSALTLNLNFPLSISIDSKDKMYIPVSDYGIVVVNLKTGLVSKFYSEVTQFFGSSALNSLDQFYYVPSANKNIVSKLSDSSTLFTSNYDILSIGFDKFDNLFYFGMKVVNNQYQNINLCKIGYYKTDTNEDITVAGGSNKCGFSIENVDANATRLIPGYYITSDNDNNVYWAQYYNADNFYRAGVMQLSYTQPTSQPTSAPSAQPSLRPTKQPTSQPSSKPTSQPSSVPTAQPSTVPTSQPSAVPTSQPSRQPSAQPSAKPSSKPSSQPSTQPTSRPTAIPTSKPTSIPTLAPNNQPIELTKGQIAGIVIGVVIGSILLAVLVYFGIILLRNYLQERRAAEYEAPPASPPAATDSHTDGNGNAPKLEVIYSKEQNINSI